MDELLAKHRKEKKELQGKIASKKKNATKKTRKGVNDESERLERELAEKQQAEIAALGGPVENEEDVTNGLEDLTLNGNNAQLNGNVTTQSTDALVDTTGHADDTIPASSQQQRKPNRQKARLARRAAEQEAEIAAAQEAAANLPDRREAEIAAMKQQFEKHHLIETQIRPDGHCLFSACATNMSPLTLALFPTTDDKKEPYQHVRLAAANFMQANGDDFAPFLEGDLDEHIRKIRETAEWGGQTELLAIARSYRRDICVLRASGQIERIEGGVGEEAKGEGEAKPIWLAYYEHSFGLGEHYNALRKREMKSS
jgi:OTU domain-containing protein 6